MAGPVGSERTLEPGLHEAPALAAAAVLLPFVVEGLAERRLQNEGTDANAGCLAVIGIDPPAQPVDRLLAPVQAVEVLVQSRRKVGAGNAPVDCGSIVAGSG